jgi:hypothetical protein
VRKVAWLKATLLRVIGISLVIIMVVYWGIKQNPVIINKLKKMVLPSDATSTRKWVLESQKIYVCGHRELKRAEYRKKGPFETVIKNYAKNVKRVNNQTFTYTERSEDLCDSCRENQFLGLAGQRLAVFRGTPGNPGPITERIVLNLKKLPEAEVEDLKKGIPFKDGKEKLQILEGLNGLSTE